MDTNTDKIKQILSAMKDCDVLELTAALIMLPAVNAHATAAVPAAAAHIMAAYYPGDEQALLGDFRSLLGEAREEIDRHAKQNGGHNGDHAC